VKRPDVSRKTDRHGTVTQNHCDEEEISIIIRHSVQINIRLRHLGVQQSGKQRDDGQFLGIPGNKTYFPQFCVRGTMFSPLPICTFDYISPSNDGKVPKENAILAVLSEFGLNQRRMWIIFSH